MLYWVYGILHNLFSENGNSIILLMPFLKSQNVLKSNIKGKIAVLAKMIQFYPYQIVSPRQSGCYKGLY